MEQKQNLSEIMQSLVKFSLPLILSGVLQQLYNWADAFIVGNINGEISLAAIGATTTPINFFITVITGFTLGLSVLIAKNFGSQNKKQIPTILAVFSVLLGGVFVLISAIGFIQSYRFMQILHTTPETIQLASNYIRIVFIGFPFLAVYNVYTATLRGIGDSRIPFLSVLVSSTINVILDIVFVVYFRAGVQGAAIATILSQIIMTIFIVIYGTNKYKWLKVRLCKQLFQRNILKSGTSFGFPPMLQSCITSLGGLVLQNFMNRFGTQTVVAITTSYRIDSLVMLPIINLGSGISTITAHSYGAGDKQRTQKILLAGILLSMIVSLILTLIVIPTGGKIIALFGAGSAAIKIGSDFFRRIACFYPVFGLATALRGYLEGKGDLLYSSLAGITALIIRIVASYAMVGLWGNMTIAYAEMLSWTCLFFIYLFRLFQTHTAQIKR